MKKRTEFLMAIMCALLLSGCEMITNTEATQIAGNDTSQISAEENAVSINLDDMETLSDKEEQYCDYLGQVTERTFIDKDGIESADATVTYDEGTEQYAIELSLKTNGKVDKGQIEDYKAFLSKTYSEVTLVVDGEVM